MLPRPHHITSLNLPDLAPYRTLRRPQDHIGQGIFVAEGEKVVRRLLNSQLEIVSFLLTQEWFEILSTAEPRFAYSASKAFIAEESLLNEIVGYRLHQGIMAIGNVPAEPPLLELVREGALIVALDGLMNSENVGVLVRNCAGFGVTAILVGETSSSPYLRRAVRNSMGAVFHLPVVHCSNLVESLRQLQSAGTTVVAAMPRGKTHIAEVDLRKTICVVFGNEESGITDQVARLCDLQVAIPMGNQMDSLNVASASAVFLYEGNRQRRG
jgi:tRNA G18 (ribose-2'-O)-methylase SpoU